MAAFPFIRLLCFEQNFQAYKWNSPSHYALRGAGEGDTSVIVMYLIKEERVI